MYFVAAMFCLGTAGLAGVVALAVHRQNKRRWREERQAAEE